MCLLFYKYFSNVNILLIFLPYFVSKKKIIMIPTFADWGKVSSILDGDGGRAPIRCFLGEHKQEEKECLFVSEVLLSFL